MQMTFKNKKLDWAKDELQVLLNKLLEGNYHQTAEVVFKHIAHTGVETDLDQSLKHEPTLEEFLRAN